MFGARVRSPNLRTICRLTHLTILWILVLKARVAWSRTRRTLDASASRGRLRDEKVSDSNQAPGMDWLYRRQESYLVGSYIGLHNTIASVSLAVGGLSGITLLHASEPIEFELRHRILWLVTLLAVFVAYTGAATGAVALPPRVPAVVDLLIPLSLAVTEFLMFGVLALQVAGLNRNELGESPLIAWYLLYAVFGALVGASVLRARRLTRREMYVEDDALDVIKRYLQRLRFDAVGAFSGSAAGVGGAILNFSGAVAPVYVDYSLVGIIALGIVGGFTSHSLTSRGLREGLARAKPDPRGGGNSQGNN